MRAILGAACVLVAMSGPAMADSCATAMNGATEAIKRFHERDEAIAGQLAQAVEARQAAKDRMATGIKAIEPGNAVAVVELMASYIQAQEKALGAILRSMKDAYAAWTDREAAVRSAMMVCSH